MTRDISVGRRAGRRQSPHPTLACTTVLWAAVPSHPGSWQPVSVKEEHRPQHPGRGSEKSKAESTRRFKHQIKHFQQSPFYLHGQAVRTLNTARGTETGVRGLPQVKGTRACASGSLRTVLLPAVPTARAPESDWQSRRGSFGGSITAVVSALLAPGPVRLYT